MRVTDVRISLCDQSIGRLRAYCALTFDNAFVIRDVKLIDGNDGLFLAMPSRKLCDRCDRCGEKNHLRARFCNNCGRKLDETRAAGDARPKLHADVAHPTGPQCRHEIEQSVLAAYDQELRKSQEPGYVAQPYLE